MYDILLFRELCIFTISLVNFISRKPGEYSVARERIKRTAKANFGLANVAEKEFVGKKAQKICLNYAMIARLL